MPYSHPSSIMRTGPSPTQRDKYLQQFFSPLGCGHPHPRKCSGISRHKTRRFSGVKKRQRGNECSLLAPQIGSSTSSSGADTKASVLREDLTPRNPGNRVTSGFLGHLPHSMLALARRQQPANLKHLKNWKCPKQPYSALLQHPLDGQKPHQSCSCSLDPWLPCPEPHTASLGRPPTSHPPPPHLTAPGEALNCHTSPLISGANWLTPPRAEPAQMPPQHSYSPCCSSSVQHSSGAPRKLPPQ